MTKASPKRGNFGGIANALQSTATASDQTPEEAPEAETPEQAPARPARAAKARRVAKFSATYRLPERTLDLIDAAQQNALDEGLKLAKEDAVAEAIEAHFGHLIAQH